LCWQLTTRYPTPRVCWPRQSSVGGTSRAPGDSQARFCERSQTTSAAGRQECCPGKGRNCAKNGSSTCLRRKAIMLRRPNRSNQYDDAWKPAAKKIPIVIARTICVTMTLNAHLLASLNAIYKIDYLFDPSTAGTMETDSVARIVVFAIARGETVPICRCISMPKIYMQPTFD
jgi:hypothetical protein